jgi:hypothetical protein
MSVKKLYVVLYASTQNRQGLPGSIPTQKKNIWENMNQEIFLQNFVFWCFVLTEIYFN